MSDFFQRWKQFLNENKQTPWKARFGYIVGDFEGNVCAEENADQLFYGASMNKPLIALANLILFKDTEKRLTEKELRGLLAYSGKYESNNINRILSRRLPRKSSKNYAELSKRKKTIGFITPKMAIEFLSKYGLSKEMLMTYGGPSRNKQSARSFFDFLKFLHNASRIKGIEKEVNIIIDYMKRVGLSGKDREFRKIRGLQDQLNRRGVLVNSIYGKGGATNQSGGMKTLNYGFVINNKVILVIYSSYNNTKYTSRQNRTHLINKIAQVLKPCLV